MMIKTRLKSKLFSLERLKTKFGSEKILHLKKFWLQKILGLKKYWAQKRVSSKEILDLNKSVGIKKDFRSKKF